MDKVVKLKPAIKSAIWGGNYYQQYGKSNLDIISELWELSVRDDDSSIIASGIDSGKRLSDVIKKEDSPIKLQNISIEDKEKIEEEEEEELEQDFNNIIIFILL